MTPKACDTIEAVRGRIEALYNARGPGEGFTDAQQRLYTSLLAAEERLMPPAA